MAANHSRSKVIYTSHSETETYNFGQTLAFRIIPQLVIGLWGDLGSGKTTLVKGLAHGLGIGKRVTSPSFALINWYDTGKMPLYHIDLYRLESPEDAINAGLSEFIPPPQGVTIVEWADRLFDDFEKVLENLQNMHFLLMPIRIRILSGNTREIEYVDPIA